MEKETYFKFFLDSAFVNESPVSFLLLFLMVLLRILPIMALSPFFGSKVLPHPVKVALGICFFIILLPHVLATTAHPLEVNLQLFVYGFKEIFVGMVIGVMTSIPFFMAETAGVYIDHQRGGSSLMVNDPIIQTQDSPLGIMQNYILIVIFYSIDGHFIFLEGLIRSYNAIPIDGFFSYHFFSEASPFWEIVLRIMAEVFRIGIQLATPALLTILMTDVFLGVANRLAQQVMITFLGMPLKSLFGLGVFCFGFPFIITQLRKQLIRWLYLFHEMINMFYFGQ